MRIAKVKEDQKILKLAVSLREEGRGGAGGGGGNW